MPLLFQFVALFVFALPPSAIALASTPVSSWFFDEGGGTVAVDSSGNGNDGILKGFPTWTPGINSPALYFGTGSDRVVVPDSPSLDITNAITLACWIKPRKTGTQYVVKKARYGDSDGYELSLSGGGQVFVRFNQASSGNDYKLYSQSYYPTDGDTWMHIAASYDGQEIKLYVDGLLESSLFAPGLVIGSNDHDLSIGSQDDKRYPFEGSIDQVHIYNDALTPASIQELVNSERDFTKCIEPSIRILQPLNNHLQTTHDLYTLAVVCFESNNYEGYGVRFTLDGGTGAGGMSYDDYTSPFEVTFTGVALGEHTIDATIINSSGVEITGSASHDQVSQVGIGNYYVAVGDSITAGAGDDISVDDISNDGRNVYGGYEPILNDLLTAESNCPHTVVNEGVGGHKSKDGLSLIPSILSEHSRARFFLVQYGTNDSLKSVSSGVGLEPGAIGYTGSFKDNMQRIITTIIQADKIPMLAKIPNILPISASRNILIREYNEVIDELVLANGLIPGPDLYQHFEAHPDEFSEYNHPNGVGYQSIAELWFSAINFTDTDGDGVSDDQDAFPNDPDEWLDTDGDGTGNNADTDDDGDGMPDDWEILYGFNPLDPADAALDADGDGVSNLDEYLQGTNPRDNLMYGQIGHWAFDEGSGEIAEDLSGNNHTGYLVNGPTWVDGRLGKALFFEESLEQRVFVRDSPDLNLGGTSFSIVFWIKYDNCIDVDVLRKGSSNTANDWYKVEVVNNKIHFDLNTDQLDTGTAGLLAPFTNDDGEWHHVAAIRDTENGFMRLYIDGEQVASRMNPAGSVSNDASLTIGSKDTEDDDFFNGSLDNIIIYDT